MKNNSILVNFNDALKNFDGAIILYYFLTLKNNIINIGIYRQSNHKIVTFFKLNIPLNIAPQFFRNNISCFATILISAFKERNGN